MGTKKVCTMFLGQYLKKLITTLVLYNLQSTFTLCLFFNDNIIINSIIKAVLLLVSSLYRKETKGLRS